MYRTNRAEYQDMLLSSYSRSLPTLKYWNRQQQINNVNAVQTKHNSVYIDRSFIKTLDGVYSREERYQDPLGDAEPAVLDYFGQLMRRQEKHRLPDRLLHIRRHTIKTAASTVSFRDGGACASWRSTYTCC